MANFRIQVIIDPTAANRGADRVERRMNRLNAVGKRVRGTFATMFLPLIGATGAIAAVRSIAQFEESIATARAVTKATEAQFESLRDRAIELGTTTRFSARQAADALVNLARAGFSVDEAINAVDDTLNLAAAAGIGLAEASNIAATAIRGFGLEVSEATKVTDVLVETANRANTTVAQLGEGIKFVAPVAAALGRSIEETSAALGVLSDSGLKATLAGTGLRRVLATLAAPSADLEALLRRVGLTVDDVNPKTEQLVDVFDRLASTGLSAGEALEIFGQRGGPAVLNLVRNTGRLRELNTELDNSAGVAQEVADILDDTLNGALIRAKSALDGLIQSFGIAGASDFLITLVDGLAASLRFLKDNIDLVIGAVTVLIALIGVKLVAAAVAAAKAMKLLSLSNPFTAALVAAVAVTQAVRSYAKELNAAAAIARQLEDDITSSFNAQGAAIEGAKRELNALNRIRRRQGFLSEGQLRRQAQLTKNIEADTKAIRDNVDKVKELNAAKERAKTTVDNLLASLDREAAALRDITRETETQQEVQTRINELLAAGIVPDQGQQKEIENRVRRNKALEDQRALLEQIKGPAEEFRRNEVALNALLAQGAISAAEFKVALADLKGELGELGVAQGIVSVDENSLDRLRESVALLQTKADQGEFVARAVSLENQLREEGVEITRAVQDEIAGLLLKQTELTEELRKQKEIEAEARRLAEREERALQSLEDKINGTARLADEQARLNTLLQDGRISAEDYSRALEDIRLRALEASTDLGAGFERAGIKLRREAENVAAAGEQIVNVFADRATEAITTFVETGKFSFKDFARSILQDLTRILIRMLVVKAIGAALGAFGGGAGGAAASVATPALAGARQRGGPVGANKSFLVGENGPEILQTNRAGTVIPNPRDMDPSMFQQQPPVVQVVNVQNEEEIPQTINDGRADEAIINALARNRDKVRQVVS